MNRIQIEDCRKVGGLEFIDWEELRCSTLLITGSTGLIGQNLVNALAYNSRVKKLGIKLILPARNVEKAESEFAWTGAEIIHYELGDELDIDDCVDYVIHLASPTSSEFFSKNPVDTMVSNIWGYKALLDWAVKHPVRKFIGLSSMEVYGFPEKGHKVMENELGAFETMNARNSYPIAKIASEALCNSYYKQFDIPTVTLRLTQTFGPGVKYNDKRIFAQFMRCVKEKKDIVLKSAGLTERCYLYTSDAVSAIILSLLRAREGEAYTVANPATYCSIKDMADMVAHDIAYGNIKVTFDIAEDIEKLGYAKTLFMDLDTGKIESLGWKPGVDLKTMYERMIDGMETDE